MHHPVNTIFGAHRHGTRRQTGMSLIEVLVSLLILSLGLLAMAGIHAASLKLTQVNQYRLAATEIAQSLSEAVKSNNEAAISGTGYITASAGGANAEPAPTCLAIADNCTPAQVAAYDLFLARRSAMALPSGDVFTQLNPATAAIGNTTPTLTIWVYWANPRVVESDTLAQQLETSCPPAVQSLSGSPRSCVQFVVAL